MNAFPLPRWVSRKRSRRVAIRSGNVEWPYSRKSNPSMRFLTLGSALDAVRPLGSLARSRTPRRTGAQSGSCSFGTVRSVAKRTYGCPSRRALDALVTSKSSGRRRRRSRKPSGASSRPAGHLPPRVARRRRTPCRRERIGIPPEPGVLVRASCVTSPFAARDNPYPTPTDCSAAVLSTALSRLLKKSSTADSGRNRAYSELEKPNVSGLYTRLPIGQ